MSSFPPTIESSGGLLARRVDQLRQTFHTLGCRLRSATADAVGQTLGTVVRDTLLHVLSGLSDVILDPGDVFSPAWNRPADEAGCWPKDAVLPEEDLPYEGPWDASSSQRMAVAVNASLASMQAWRRWGGQSLLAALGIGLLAGSIAYFAPSLALAALGLNRCLRQFQMLHETLRALP